MRTALLVAGKDLRQRLRDKSAFLYGIVAPLGLAFIFSFVFNPIDSSTYKADAVIVDQDRGPLAAAFSKMLQPLEDDGVITLRQVGSVAEAERQVEAGSDTFADKKTKTADVAFLVPAGLSKDVLGGKGGEITVLGAAGSPLASQIGYSVAKSFAAETKAVEVAIRTTGEDHDGSPAAVRGLSAAAAATKSPVELRDATAGVKQLDQKTYLAAGMSMFFLFFTVSFGVSGLLEERRLGTMDRMLTAPIDPRSILAGKGITSFVLGVTSMSILVIATTLLLGAEWGDPLGVALLVVAAVLAAMGILSIVAAFAKTSDQAGSFQAIVSIVLAFVGGAFFSVAEASGVLARAALFTPHAWFLRGLGDLQGGQLSAIWPAVGALLAFGLVTGTIGWTFLGRAVRR